MSRLEGLHGVVLELESLKSVTEHSGLGIGTDTGVVCNRRGCWYHVVAVNHVLDEQSEHIGVVFGESDAQDGLRILK